MEFNLKNKHLVQSVPTEPYNPCNKETNINNVMNTCTPVRYVLILCSYMRMNILIGKNKIKETKQQQNHQRI